MRFEYFKNEKTDTLYVRVNKKVARTAFNCGSCVVITPVNANPNFWNGALLHFCSRNDDNETGLIDRFERVCNSIIFYDCHRDNMGAYLKYFLPKNVAIKYGYRG